MEEIKIALENEIITEISAGQEIQLENHALMITKQLVYENKESQTRLGVILYPFQKIANPYENYLQLQLYPKTHIIWHMRKLFKLDDFDLILNLANRFPNNYYLCDYLFCKYLEKFRRGAVTTELVKILEFARKSMDHSSLWCWYRCSQLELPSKQDEIVEQIKKMAAFQWNSALENIIYALFIEFRFEDLRIYLEPLFLRRSKSLVQVRME